MKNYLLLIIITVLCYSQSSGFSIYGVGENMQNNAPASLSMGNSLFFSGNSKNISTGSPSSLWRSALTRFTIHSGMNVLKSTQFPQQYHHSLTSFSLLFPVGNKKVFGFGLQPVFRTNKLDIRDSDFQYIGVHESSRGLPIAFKNNYSIDGGISEIFLEYSQKLYPHYSGGLKYSFLFGNQYLDDELYTYDVEIDSISTGLILSEIVDGSDTLYARTVHGMMTELNKSHKFSGSIFTVEGRYTDEKQEWVVRTSINSKIQVSTQNIQCIGLCIDNSDPDTTIYKNSSSSILSELAIGYQYQFKNNSGITLELHKEYPFNIPANVALFNIMPPEQNSIHFGSYYQIRNSKIGFWNNLNIRGGAYLKELDFTGEKFLDYGGTLGLGIEYLGYSQSIDLALRAGKKESRVLDGEYEEYISFHIGIITGEKWFMKSRRK